MTSASILYISNRFCLLGVLLWQKVERLQILQAKGKSDLCTFGAFGLGFCFIYFV